MLCSGVTPASQTIPRTHGPALPAANPDVHAVAENWSPARQVPRTADLQRLRAGNEVLHLSAFAWGHRRRDFARFAIDLGEDQAGGRRGPVGGAAIRVIGTHH